MLKQNQRYPIFLFLSLHSSPLLKPTNNWHIKTTKETQIHTNAAFMLQDNYRNDQFPKTSWCQHPSSNYKEKIGEIESSNISVLALNNMEVPENNC